MSERREGCTRGVRSDLSGVIRIRSKQSGEVLVNHVADARWGGTEMFDIVLRMDGLRSFSEEWKHSRKILVEGVWLRVLPLDRTSKRAANRPKDKLVIGI